MRKGALLFLSLLLIPVGAQAKLKKSMKKECLVCHENWLLEAKIKSPKLLSLQSFDAANKLMCLSCHDGSLADDRETFLGFEKFSHPVEEEVPEDFKMPKDFPTKDGKLYCGTCHTPHTETGSEKKLDYTFMRKPNVNSKLCMECHEENAEGKVNHPILKDTGENFTEELAQKVVKLGGKVTKKGELQCESCHSPHRGKAKKALIEKVKRSELCIVCHEESLNSKEHPDYRNHPIHKDFPEDAELLAFKEKKAITESVECLTCHRTHREENEHLLTFKEKKLCALCHVEEKRVNITKHNIDKKSCRSCHIAHKAKGKKLWSFKLPEEAYDYASIIDAKGKNDILCLSCHYTGNTIKGEEVKSVGTLTHPTGSKVKEKIDLPLVEGRTSCTTCHDPHHGFSDDEKSKFLRKEKLSVCSTCHKEQTDVKRGAHAEIDKKKWEKGDCSACHNVHDAKGGYLSRLVYGEISPMEPPVDGFCLACHDPEGMAEHKVKQSVFSEHPVGVNNPSEELPGKKVSCVTCHEPHLYSDKLLRIPVEKDSKLCLTCHEEQNLKGTPHDVLNREVKIPEKERKELEKSGACSLCHTPHNPEYRVLWSKKVGSGKTVGEKLCNTCHSKGKMAEDKTTGRYTHPIGKKVTEENLKMIRESKLPLINQMTGYPAEKGEPGLFDCTTCHDPHNGADREKLTRYTVAGDASLCTACHVQEGSVVGTEHDMRVSTEDYKNSVGETVEEGGVCSACHIPHRAKNELLWANELKGNGNITARYCLSCHTKGGVGEKKVVKYYYHPSKDIVVRSFDRPGRKGNWLTFGAKGETVTSGGEITCETCHDPHVWSKWTDKAPGKPVEGSVLNSFLKNKSVSGSICVDCHGLDALYRYKFFHDKRVHSEKPSYK